MGENGPFNLTECTDLNSLNSTVTQCQVLMEVLTECSEDSWIDYTYLFYCQIGAQSKFGPLIVSAIILFVLFIALGVTADDFLCPSLLTISKSLKLNQEIVGVTFLAFGNGAPDIITSFAGISQSRVELVIGELFGAGIFVTTIVFGSILITSDFKLLERPLIRDVVFYLASCFFAWSICFQRAIHLWQVILFLIIYVLYIVVVLVGRLIYTRSQKGDKRILTSDSSASFEPSASESSSVDTSHQTPPSTYRKFNNEVDCIDHNSQRNVIPSISLTVSPDLAGDSIDASPTVATSFEYFNSSAYDSFRSAKSATSSTFNRSYNGSIHSRHSLRGHHDNALYSLTHSDEFSPREERCTDFHCMSSPVSNGDGNSNSNSNVNTANSEGDDNNLCRRRGRPSLDANGNSEYNDRQKDIEYLESLNWWQDFFFHVIPFDLQEFRAASPLQKAMTLMKAPFYIILTLTVPVVDHENHLSNWCRLLNSIHCITGPLVITLVSGFFFKFIHDSFPVALIVALVGLIFATVVMLTSQFRQAPVYHSVFAYLGFIVAVAWIYSLANEVVSLLKSVGILFSVSDVILGLTVLALGNSLGDFVSNLSMARQGFPRIGVSACFGGPLMSKYSSTQCVEVGYVVEKKRCL